MKIIFLGSGSAFTLGEDNFHCNLLLVGDQERNLLIDCGSDLRFSLHQAGFTPCHVTDIYISHLHSDHIGGLEYLGFSTLFDPHCLRPNLYLSKELASELWEHSLSGGMRSLEGDLATLDTYFNTCAIEQNGFFRWEGIQFQLVRVPHVHNGYYLMPSYGLFFEVEGTRIFLTTDTQFCPELLSPYYEQADLIFHDCETGSIPTPVHARYEQLLQLPSDIRDKMWLCGYQPGPKPDPRQDGFRGFVKRGQVFEFCKPNLKQDYLVSAQISAQSPLHRS
jgi:ribonuclease BN (tRNA processing enzyme)